MLNHQHCRDERVAWQIREDRGKRRVESALIDK
jgi:hypothetical protein